MTSWFGAGSFADEEKAGCQTCHVRDLSQEVL